MPAVYSKDKRVRKTKHGEYLKYLDDYLNKLTDEQLIQACVDIADNLLEDPENPEVKAGTVSVFRDELGRDLKKFAADTTESGQKQYIGVRNATCLGIKALIIKEGAFLVDANDEIKYNIHLVDAANVEQAIPKNLLPHDKKMLRMRQAAGDFKIQCMSLAQKNPALANDKDFATLRDAFNRTLDAIEKTRHGEFGEFTTLQEQLMQNVIDMDKQMQKLKVYDVNYDLSYIYLLLCLHRFRAYTDLYALYLTILHAAYRGRTFAKAVAVKAGRAVAYAAKGAWSAAVSAVGYPNRKRQRLWDQGILNALAQEWNRFDESARSAFGMKGNYWESFKNKALGSFMQKPGDVFSKVGLGFAALMVFVPVRVAIGAMNERYNFINQVKLGVTGSTLGDKRPFMDKGPKGEKVPMFKISDTEESKKSNNKLLIVQTHDYDPIGQVGAAAIIKKGKDGHAVFLMAHDEDSGKKVLELLCKAAKDSDRSKLEIVTRAPPEEMDIKLVKEFIENIKPEYKHIDIVVNNVSENDDAKKKSKPRIS